MDEQFERNTRKRKPDILHLQFLEDQQRELNKLQAMFPHNLGAMTFGTNPFDSDPTVQAALKIVNGEA